MKNKVLVFIVALIIVGAAGFFGYKYMHRTQQRSAVFMTNGQVYFGYITGTSQSTITLSNVYYLKIADLQNSTNQQILLVKMGNELHGPESNMYIDRSQILFWQMLRPDSKINTAIAKFSSS